eukprot:7492247-Alexandrium_andersonii.AAC.1
MSASLVGSEMCIRDRASSPSPPSRALPGATRTGPLLSRVSRRFGTRSKRCLLYTSDAADDM